MIEVTVPSELPKPPAINVKISEIMLREMDVNVTDIVRKVAMNSICVCCLKL